MNLINMLGVNIDNITLAEASDQASRWLEEGGKYSVFTPNPEILYIAHKDESFRSILGDADMLLPDGIGVVLASKLLEFPLKQRVAGIDFVAELFDKGREVYLLGGRPGVAEQAAESLKPYVDICGFHDGYFDDDGAVVHNINASGAEILVVCLGAPKQEKWIMQYRELLAPVIVIGAGGAIDVLAGNVKRAPKWMQKMGLEWLYRVVCEPKRIVRLAAIPKFLWAVFRERMNK